MVVSMVMLNRKTRFIWALVKMIKENSHGICHSFKLKYFDISNFNLYSPTWVELLVLQSPKALSVT